MSNAAADLEALQRRVAGEVVVPGSPDYDTARKGVSVRFHHVRPQAVVRCTTAGDVVQALAYARRSGAHVAPRSGGHCFAGRSSTEGIVIDVTPMNAVSVTGGVATVGAGTQLAELYDALDEHGLTIPAGCGPTVGIAGLTLGGGLGILGRKHGLTCDHLIAARVVLADGRVIECDEHHHPDLFWALRGAGGGHFGVVTSLVFKTVPAPPATTFHLVWPHAHAPALIKAWQDWAPDAPDELDASLRLTAAGDPGSPPVANLLGALLGDEADAVAVLEPLVNRVGADPASTSQSHLPFRAAKRSLSELGSVEHASSGLSLELSKSEFFRRALPTEAIAALVETQAQARGRGESRELNFTPWGGAYNRVAADATAFAHRNERFLLEHVLIVDPEAPSAARRWVADSWATVHPWGCGRVYPNFPDLDLAGWPRAYHGANHERLLRIKHAYDPSDVFCSSQPLSRSSSLAAAAARR